jgi:hypothetical protein
MSSAHRKWNARQGLCLVISNVCRASDACDVKRLTGIVGDLAVDEVVVLLLRRHQPRVVLLLERLRLGQLALPECNGLTISIVMVLTISMR